MTVNGQPAIIPAPFFDLSGPMDTFDIAIVGGGMVGLTLVRALRPALEAGARVVLIDPAPRPAQTTPQSPSFDDRATALSAFTRLGFERLGIWPELAPFATDIRWIEVSDRGHAGYQVMNAEEFPGHPFGAVVANSSLGQVLWRQAEPMPGVEWRFGDEVSRMTPTAEHQQLELASGEPVSARQVFLCDGGRSPLTQALGIQQTIKDYHAYARVATVRTEQHHAGRAFERFTEEGPIAMLPFGRFSALVWTLPERMRKRMGLLTPEQERRWLTDRFGHRLGRITEIGETVEYPLSLRQTLEPARHRLLVLGNSAATLHPVAGQGFNLALRSVLRAAQHMNEAFANGADLGDYRLLSRLAGEIESDQALTARFSDNLVRTFASNHPLIQVGRTLGLNLLDRHPLLRNAFTLASMGLLQGAVLPKEANS